MGHDGAVVVSKPIKRRRDGSLQVRLPTAGVNLLRDAIGSLLDRLDPADEQQVRLFPRAYADDADEARFRELTHGYLIAAKQASMRILSELLEEARSGRGEVSELILDDDQVSALLGCLNDLRLVLGTMLGVTDDAQPTGLLRPDDPEAAQVNAYLWLGALQEGLLEVLLAEQA